MFRLKDSLHHLAPVLDTDSFSNLSDTLTACELSESACATVGGGGFLDGDPLMYESIWPEAARMRPAHPGHSISMVAGSWKQMLAKASPQNNVVQLQKMISEHGTLCKRCGKQYPDLDFKLT